ncbi:MAG: TraR/DksA family transcriptional regulator [Chitinophagaceae bacterium]
MATKKKKAVKKAAKPAPKKKAAAKPARPAGKKPVAKKTVKKTAPKPAAKKAAKPAPKKPAPKPVAKKTAKPAPKPAPKPVAKAPVKQEVAPKPVVRKPGSVDPKSLVSIKPKVQPVIKKEPPKPSKVVIPKTTTKSSVKYEPEFTKSILDAHSPVRSEGPTMRYSDNDLNEFREIIQKKLDAAKKELSYLQGLITRKDEGGDMDEARYMTMEDGSVSMEREQLSQMASRQITFIDHLEKAMMRIENKTYGICRVTGKLIDKARLRAVPHATLSIEAKQMMNK